MSQEDFHFIDLLGLHLKARLDVPGCQGLLPLLNHLTGLSLGSLIMYPHLMVDAARMSLHQQYPWLAPIAIPGWMRARDWSAFWGWADTIQHRVGTDADAQGTAYRVETMGLNWVFENGTAVLLVDDLGKGRDIFRRLGLTLEDEG